MRSTVIAALASFALVTPALGQSGAVYDEQSGTWITDAPPPPNDEGAYPSPTVTDVDVSVDMASPGASVTFDSFHDGLAPYGEWTTVGSYGRVWRPRVAAGWRPYYYGRWEWTDEGWLWASDEPWGWAAYHYGRWAYDSVHGWMWIPGYQWAPAWVTWRYSPDYIGWAPLGPGFSVYVTSYPVVYGWWTFVPCNRFVGVPVHSFAFTGSRVRGIWAATHPAPPRASVFGARAPAWGGPAHPFVEQRIGRPIAPVRIQPVASPSQIAANRHAGVVPVYRPEARFRAARPAAPAAPAAPTTGGGRPAPAAPMNAFRGAPPAGGQPHAAAPPANGFRSAVPAPQPAPQPGRPQGGFHAPAPAGPRAFQGGAAAPSAPAQHAPPAMRAPQPAPAPAMRTPQSAPAPAMRAPQPAPAPAPARPQGSYAPARPQGGYAPALRAGSSGGGHAPAVVAHGGGHAAAPAHRR